MPSDHRDSVRNRLLGPLPAAELRHVLARLERVALPLHGVLLTSDAPVGAMWFVERGSVSMLAEFGDGGQGEVGLVGREGAVGLPLVLGSGISSVRAIVQVPGAALRLPAAAFPDALAGAPTLAAALLRYADAFHVQVAQTAACNGRHPIERRLARWLLMTQDRAESDTFAMTQEFLAAMLGVRRPGVTVAVGGLVRAGLVRQGRGVLTVLDRAGLEGAACDCYGIVRRRHDRLLAAPRDGVAGGGGGPG